jgi:hypothetical protein
MWLERELHNNDRVGWMKVIVCRRLLHGRHHGGFPEWKIWVKCRAGREVRTSRRGEIRSEKSLFEGIPDMKPRLRLVEIIIDKTSGEFEPENLKIATGTR